MQVQDTIEVRGLGETQGMREVLCSAGQGVGNGMRTGTQKPWSRVFGRRRVFVMNMLEGFEGLRDTVQCGNGG